MPTEKRLGEELVDCGVISERQLNEALRVQEKAQTKIGRVLVNHGFILEGHLKKLLASRRNYRTVTLKDFSIPANVKAIFPEKLSRQFNVLPMEIRADFVVVLAMDDPEHLELIKEIQHLSHLYVDAVYAGYWEINACLARNYESISPKSPERVSPGGAQNPAATFDLLDVKMGDLIYNGLREPAQKSEPSKNEEIDEEDTQEFSQPAFRYFHK